MSVTQQYLLDTYRAAQHGEPMPPAPGQHDWQAVREVRDYGRFRAVVQERPARGRLRAALARFVHGDRLRQRYAARTPRPLP
ncbi:hypothetical protein [Streptomyces kanamyceticus]|uniref:Uncharacterized protein n=1 Tax=Streptomyces kanamyceticus TaxID=1967 RepID=A0A5J6GCU7_STRKN|nr:hypothetical protein [Streptomyces kanamyceticus]QEU92727.1 hypothetical protein CP970_19060 [Streptomyces kanamyceticus]